MSSGNLLRFQIFALIAISIFLEASRARETHQEPTEAKLTPPLAKDALLKMMRSKEGQGLDWFKGNIADEMAKFGIEEEINGWFAWTAAYRFHPTKAIYTLTIMPKPGSNACIVEYEGSFVRRDKSWLATTPKLVQTVRPFSK
jgi:hypothetical protein